MATEQEDKISRIKDFKAKIESENSQIKQRIDNFQTEGKKNTEAFNLAMTQSKKKILDSISSLMKIIETTTKDFEDYKKKTLLSDKDALNTRLENLLGEITSGVEKLQNVMVELSSKQEREISSIYSQMSSKVNTGLSEIYSGQRQQISEFEKDISSRLETIQGEIVSTVERESTSQREMTESITSALLGSLIDFRTKISDLSDTKETNVDVIFAGTVSDSVSRLEMAKEDLLAAIDGAMSQLEDSCNKQKTENEQMQKTIQETILTGKSDVKNRIEKQRLDLMEDWKKLKDNQVTALSQIKETTDGSFQEALKTNESFQSKLTSELENNLKSSLYNEIDNISLSFTKYQDSIISQIDSLISRLTSTRDEMKASLDNLLISNLNKIGGLGKQFEQHLVSVLSQISTEYKTIRESTYSNLTSSLSDRISLVNSSLDQYQDKTDKMLEKTGMDLDVSLMNFFDKTQNSIKETITKNDSNLDLFTSSLNDAFKQLQSGQDKNLETTLTDIKNTLRSKQSELITAISSIAPAADDHVESNKKIIEEKKKEIASSSTAAFDDLRKHITSIERDGMNSIHSIVSDTFQKLDEKVKISEQSTKDLIEGLEDKHKNSIAKFKANAKQEFNKKQELLDNYRTGLKDKLNQFFDQQQGSLDHFLDDIRIKRENVDDLRRNIDIRFEELNTGMDTAIETLNVNINTNTQNVNTEIKQIIKNVDDVLKAIK